MTLSMLPPTKPAGLKINKKTAQKMIRWTTDRALIQGSNGRHDRRRILEHGGNLFHYGIGSVNVRLIGVPLTRKRLNVNR